MMSYDLFRLQRPEGHVIAEFYVPQGASASWTPDPMDVPQGVVQWWKNGELFAEGVYEYQQRYGLNFMPGRSA